MTYRTLKFDLEEEVGLLTLNRPERLNAVNAAMLEELNSFWEEMQGRQDCRVIVMTGAGERGFCSGLDLKEASDLQGGVAAEGISGDSIQRGQLRFSSIVEKMRTCPQPVIAAVNGFALGGGCEIALACDIRVLADTAKIGQPEVNLGLLPGFGGTQRLARLVGPGKAKELIFTADAIDAAEALRIGLANKVVPADKLFEVVGEMARKIAAKGPAAVRLAKTCINRGLDADLNTGNALEIEAFGVCFSSGEPAEGTRAFLEKRKPDWKPAKE